MIITVTLDPVLRKAATLDALRPGGTHHLRNMRVAVEGKGIAASRMIASLGGDTLATGFVAGSSGESISQILKQLMISNDFVRVDGNTPVKLSLTDPQGRMTELNEPEPEIRQRDVHRLRSRLVLHVAPGDIVILSGGAPGGLDAGVYAQLVRTAHAQGALAFLDATGEALRAALEEKPDFIRLNLAGLGEYLGVEPQMSRTEMAEACHKLLIQGVGGVALTLGGDGALFMGGKNSQETLLFAPALPVEVCSAAGAGDSMMGALAYGFDNKLPWRQTIVLGMAASAAAVSTGDVDPPRELVDSLATQVRLQGIS
jgi:1-phosphofructokinase